MQIPAPPPSSGSYMDTVVDKTKLIYKTETIEGYKVYYSIETADTLKKGAIIGSCHFLSSALIFENDSVLIAPVFKLSELYGLKFSDFKYYIPPIVKTSDTISIIDGKKKMLLYNFKKVTLLINGKEYTNCLNIQITERWPNAIYSGTVWLSKKYGVLKWMRTTRRIETRDL